MGRIASIPLLMMTLVGPLAACGPPLGWQKPGVSMAEAQVDRRECANLARDQAFRESVFGPPYFYSGYYGGYGGYGAWPSRFGPPYPSAFGYHSYDSFMWRSQRENDLQDFCLRARGYKLAPIAEQ